MRCEKVVIAARGTHLLILSWLFYIFIYPNKDSSKTNLWIKHRSFSEAEVIDNEMWHPVQGRLCPSEPPWWIHLCSLGQSWTKKYSDKPNGHLQICSSSSTGSQWWLWCFLSRWQIELHPLALSHEFTIQTLFFLFIAPHDGWMSCPAPYSLLTPLVHSKHLNLKTQLFHERLDTWDPLTF